MTDELRMTETEARLAKTEALLRHWYGYALRVSDALGKTAESNDVREPGETDALLSRIATLIRAEDESLIRLMALEYFFGKEGAARVEEAINRHRNGGNWMDES